MLSKTASKASTTFTTFTTMSSKSYAAVASVKPPHSSIEILSISRPSFDKLYEFKYSYTLENRKIFQGVEYAETELKKSDILKRHGIDINDISNFEKIVVSEVSKREIIYKNTTVSYEEKTVVYYGNSLNLKDLEDFLIGIEFKRSSTKKMTEFVQTTAAAPQSKQQCEKKVCFFGNYCSYGKLCSKIHSPVSTSYFRDGGKTKTLVKTIECRWKNSCTKFECNFLHPRDVQRLCTFCDKLVNSSDKDHPENSCIPFFKFCHQVTKKPAQINDVEEDEYATEEDDEDVEVEDEDNVEEDECDDEVEA